MASAVARRSVATASRLGRPGFPDLPEQSESILELAKQDLHSQMQKAKVTYKNAFQKSSCNNKPTSRASFKSRKILTSRVTRDPMGDCAHKKRFSKTPAPRCHGKTFKRENLIVRGINKVKNGLYGLKVVPRRLLSKKSPAKNCLNARGLSYQTKPILFDRRNESLTRDYVCGFASKIPLPVSDFSRRQNVQSILDKSEYYSSTSTLRSNQEKNTKNDVTCLQDWCVDKNANGKVNKEFKHNSMSCGNDSENNLYDIQTNVFRIKSSRELSETSAHSPVSWCGSRQEYKYGNVDAVKSSYKDVRRISETLCILPENKSWFSENIRHPSENVPSRIDIFNETMLNVQHSSQNNRPKSLELDAKALSLPERRHRLEKDLDELMDAMEKVLGNSINMESYIGTWPRKSSLEKPKARAVIFGRPVFEAVI